MHPLTTEFKSFLQNLVLHLKEDMKGIRTGRANPSLLETLVVETYGGQSKLKLMEIATIVNDGPTALAIAPYDPSTVQDIEKAILKSPLGITPQTLGNKITVRLPALSEEQREKMIKLVHQKVEERRVMLRNQRDEVRKKVRHLLDNKEITEDDKFRFEKEIDSIAQTFNGEMETVMQHKEAEIREV